MLRWTSFLFHNWRAKLGALALAAILWVAIRHGIRYSPSFPPVPPAPNPEATPRG